MPNDKILQDEKNGKEQPWREKRLMTDKICDSFCDLKMWSRAERTANCATFLKFKSCEKDGYKKLVKANFCRDRLCPMCSWRRSMKLHGQTMDILHESVKRRKMRFIFLTLTIRNVKANELSETLTDLYDSFKLMFKYKEIDRVVLGYVNALEVTYKINADEYHPHFHVLIGVRPEYFTNNYIKQARWTELWQQAMKIDYQPIVHVQVVKANKNRVGSDAMQSGVAEVTKYTVKDSNYIFEGNKELTNKVVEVLAVNLAGRRLVTYGKLFRKVKAELKLQDLESDNADLIGVSEECNCPICQSKLKEILYSWHPGFNNYIVQKDIFTDSDDEGTE